MRSRNVRTSFRRCVKRDRPWTVGLNFAEFKIYILCDFRLCILDLENKGFKISIQVIY